MEQVMGGRYYTARTVWDRNAGRLREMRKESDILMGWQLEIRAAQTGVFDLDIRISYLLFIDVNRAAQTGVFDLDIRISKRPSIDVYKFFAAKTGLKSRNVEKRINVRLSGPNTPCAAETGLKCRNVEKRINAV
jgi:hypothetical protein